MSAKKVTHHPPLYLQYLTLSSTSYSDILKWYETNYKQIRLLNDALKTRIDIDYTLSLFHVGRCQQYIIHCDELIEKVIRDNIFYHNGKDIYRELLFCKAACYYNVHQLEDSLYILLQLCKMDKKNSLYHNFASKVIRLHSYHKFATFKSVALSMIFSSIVLIAIELLVIRTLFTEYTTTIELIRNASLTIALAILVLNEIRLQQYIRSKLGTYVYFYK